MSQESWNQFEQEAARDGELFIGCRDGDVTEFAPSVTSTGARTIEGK